MPDKVLVQLGGAGQPQVTVQITQNVNGSFHFDVAQATGPGATIGDIRGLFFDVDNDTALAAAGNQVAVTGFQGFDPAGTQFLSSLTTLVDGNDTVIKTGGATSDNTMAGALFFDDTGPEATGYDVGMEFGIAGIGKINKITNQFDDVRHVDFDFTSPGTTTLDQFLNHDFGLRMTSVGLDGDLASRINSVKLTGTGFTPYDDGNETIGCVDENTSQSGDLTPEPANVHETITGFSIVGPDGFSVVSGAFDTPIALGATGAKVTVAADGSYTIDSTGVGTSLNDGDHVPFTLTYNIAQTYLDTAGHEIGHLTDASHMDFEICGTGEVVVNPTDNFGLSPGYWKTHNGDGIPGPDNINLWPTDYTATFDSVFGVDWAIAGGTTETLLDSVSDGGGGIDALARQVTAVYLDILSSPGGVGFTDPTDPGGNFIDTPAEFIAFVHNIDTSDATLVATTTLFLDHHI